MTWDVGCGVGEVDVAEGKRRKGERVDVTHQLPRDQPSSACSSVRHIDETLPRLARGPRSMPSYTTHTCPHNTRPFDFQ